MDFFRGKIPTGEAADEMVERALLLSAMGYTVTEERVESSDKGGEKRTVTKKPVAPSMSAISMWLTHRCPETWGDGAAEMPENNLLTLLCEGLRGDESDSVSDVQREAEAGDDLVGPPGDEGAGRDSV